MHDQRPIGIFDSGLGGLTVAKEIFSRLPNESTIYIGDSARVPYGNRSPETVTKFTTEAVEALIQLGVKSIVIACGTASSIALPKIQIQYPSIPILGVIDPAAKSACAVTKTGHIGVIGTNATINSDAFGQAIRLISPTSTIHRRSCPLFVPIIEEGIIDDHPILIDTIKHYLSDFKKTSVDTLILGCTHYPIINRQISNYLPKISLINSGISVASELANLLTNKQICGPVNQKPTHQFFVTDKNVNYQKIATTFLNREIEIRKISI